MRKESLKNLVLKKEKEGKVVLMTIDGHAIADLENFIKQPADGILYDLNRDRATVLTCIEDSKWVNDFAAGLVIARLKKKLENAIPAISLLQARLERGEYLSKEDGIWHLFDKLGEGVASGESLQEILLDLIWMDC